MKHQIHADLVHLARPIGEVRINPANTNTHPEEQLEVLASMFQEFGQRGPLIVRKSTGILEAGEGRAPTLTRSDYQWQHEPILYGWREGAAHYWCGSRTERTVWDHRKPGRSKEHPTMKPVELVAQAIANSSRPPARSTRPPRGALPGVRRCDLQVDAQAGRAPGGHSR